MKIRYSTGFAVFILVAAALILGTSVLTGATVNLFTGTILLVIGISYMVRPLGELTAGGLTVFALFGPVKKQYPIGLLRVVDGKLYSGDKKVRIPVWCANSADWRTVLERLQPKLN